MGFEKSDLSTRISTSRQSEPGLTVGDAGSRPPGHQRFRSIGFSISSFLSRSIDDTRTEFSAGIIPWAQVQRECRVGGTAGGFRPASMRRRPWPESSAPGQNGPNLRAPTLNNSAAGRYCEAADAFPAGKGSTGRIDQQHNSRDLLNLHARAYIVRRPAQKAEFRFLIEYTTHQKQEPCHAHAVDCPRKKCHIVHEIRQKQR